MYKHPDPLRNRNHNDFLNHFKFQQQNNLTNNIGIITVENEGAEYSNQDYITLVLKGWSDTMELAWILHNLRKLSDNYSSELKQAIDKSDLYNIIANKKEPSYPRLNDFNERFGATYLDSLVKTMHDKKVVKVELITNSESFVLEGIPNDMTLEDIAEYTNWDD